MRLVKWEKLPADMQTEEVREYYDVLRKKRFSLFWKRIFDIFVSAIMLIILSPLFLILAIAIKTDSKKTVCPGICHRDRPVHKRLRMCGRWNVCIR